jgi:ubiquinone/menaquinone biosynthesis C-methylase UbiE
VENVERKKLIQKYYAVRAKDYDRQKSRTWKSPVGFGMDVANELLDALKGFGGKLVLEVGVGSGRNTLLLLEKVQPWFVGLDLSREILAKAKTKLVFSKHCVDLVLGDAEHPPFVDAVFDALICMSTMHYFIFQQEMLIRFSRLLKREGHLFLGDLTLHESDEAGFLNKMEKTISKAHGVYHRPFEIAGMLESCAFWISKMKTAAYTKSFAALMEDKGAYFGVKPEALRKCIEEASATEKRLYSVSDEALALFYTTAAASKNKHQ